MKRTWAACFLTAATSFAAIPLVSADDAVPARGFLSSAGRVNSRSSGRPGQIPAERQVATSAAAKNPQPAPATRATASRSQSIYARPVAWGLRFGVGYAYPASAIGQTVQSLPAYAQPGYGTPSISGAPAANPPGGYSDKYAYAGRTYSAGSFSSAYNSGYYTSGCYYSNACCRASRRLCTPFGGMTRGHGSGCYVPTPPPCPTACAYSIPSYPRAGGGTYAPPAYGTPTPVPSSQPVAPPAPADTIAPPQPVEKKVTPAPQANIFPRIPGLPPDA